MTAAVERKAYDTRPLLFVLTNEDASSGEYPLTGAHVAITIASQSGAIVRRNATCEVLDVQSGLVAYWPTRDDFAIPGTYSLQWLATYDDGTSARWPHDSTFGQAVVHFTVAQSAAVLSRSSLDTVGLVDAVRVIVARRGELIDEVSGSDVIAVECSNYLYTETGDIVVTDDLSPVTLR